MDRDMLVVDDELAMRRLLTILLQEEGYDVTTASNGIETLERLEQMSFDVVVVDLMIPGMNGIELLKEIKHRVPGSEVIILTAYASIESAVAAIESGAYAFIEKDPRGLSAKRLTKVAQALEHRRDKIEIALAY